MSNLRFLKIALHWLRVLAGSLVYLWTGNTPGFAHQSMVALFCLTGGRSNDLISKVISVLNRPYSFANADGVLGDMNDQERRRRIVDQLRSSGYYVFDSCIPSEACDRLLRFALSHPGTVRPMDGVRPGNPIRARYTRTSPVAVRYDFEPQDLLRNPDIQALLGDLSFAALAQDYLGCRPVLDVLTMWWHTSFSCQPDSGAGQFFHFDLDRPKWLKFFIYLTDVNPENGPHAFVAGSHRTGALPATLLSKGYSRLSDQEVRAVFPAPDVLELTAPRGSVIVEDTRGLHKGKHVLSGDRLMLQLQFSNSLYGCYYPPSQLDGVLSAELASQIGMYPRLYSAYAKGER